MTRNGRRVTRDKTSAALTIEKLAFDALDVRSLRKRGVFTGEWMTFRPMLGWTGIRQMHIAKYAILLELRGRPDQRVRVSWTRPYLGGERPWMHCPHCQTRVAKLYNGLAGYFCRRCVGNPLYASQALSAQSRGHFQAGKLRLRLGGHPELTAPIPKRRRRTRRRTYDKLINRLLKLEGDLSKRLKLKDPDYPSLVAYFQ